MFLGKYSFCLISIHKFNDFNEHYNKILCLIFQIFAERESKMKI